MTVNLSSNFFACKSEVIKNIYFQDCFFSYQKYWGMQTVFLMMDCRNSWWISAPLLWDHSCEYWANLWGHEENSLCGQDATRISKQVVI